MGAGVVAVEVFMYVEDEVCRCAIKVGDRFERSKGAVRYELPSRGVVVAGEKNVLRRRASLTDCGNSGLHGGGPGRDARHIMGLVHDTKDNLGLTGVLLCELGPDTGELGVAGAALTDDLAIPARVVMDIDDAVGACCEAGLDFLVVGSDVVSIESAT